MFILYSNTRPHHFKHYFTSWNVNSPRYKTWNKSVLMIDHVGNELWFDESCGKSFFVSKWIEPSHLCKSIDQIMSFSLTFEFFILFDESIIP